MATELRTPCPSSTSDRPVGPALAPVADQEPRRARWTAAEVVTLALFGCFGSASLGLLGIVVIAR
jgi:hypothetical protein